MQKERKSKSNFKAGALLVSLGAVLCAGILISVLSVQDVIEVQQIKPERYWRKAHGDADPGGDLSGFMYFMTYVHQAAPATPYGSNLSNTSVSCLEYSDTLDTEMNNETNHTDAFDFVMKFRVNDTVAFNSSGNTWMPSWIAANITVDFDTAADVAWTNMTLILIANSTAFAWYHAYINNSGSGYTITHNEKFNATVNVSLWW